MGCAVSPLTGQATGAGSALKALGIHGALRMGVGEREGGAPLISEIPNVPALEGKVQTRTRAGEKMVISPP